MDITERQRAEGLLRAANARVAMILDSITDKFFAIDKCCGLQWKRAWLAIGHPCWPTMIESVGCSRPTLSAPEPRLLILGSQSAPAGSHYVHRDEAWRMTVLEQADGGSHAPVQLAV